MRRAVLLVTVLLEAGCKSGSSPMRRDERPAGSAADAAPRPPVGREIVAFPSGALTLHGIVYRPKPEGLFPAILWNHGSYRDPMVAFDELGPVFAGHGWIFFGPFRRGQGLSADAGPYIDDEIDRALQQGGSSAAEQTMVRLLAGAQLDDQLAAYRWLAAQPSVAAGRIAVGGNSFGGIEAVLGAARLRYCAAVDGAGAAQTWARSPDLREVLLQAVRQSRPPVLFFQAANDLDLAPSKALAAAMTDAGKVAELKIYPPFGSNHGQGHNFAWHGSAVWAADVLAFLDRHCP